MAAHLNIIDDLLSHADGHFAVSHLSNEDLDQLISTLRSLDAIVHVAEGKNAPSSGQLLISWGEELHFPDYYGKNWDALDECLADHETRPRGPTFIVINHAEDLLKRDRPFQQNILVSVLNKLPRKREGSGYNHDWAVDRFPPLWMLLNFTAGSTRPRWTLELSWPESPPK